jgi:hypothetical protein
LTKEKEPAYESGELGDKQFKSCFGMDPEQSLLSVNFATTDNPYLNEHEPNDTKVNENESSL